MVTTNRSWSVFFTISLALHLLLLISLPKLRVQTPVHDVISVAMIPAREPARKPSPPPPVARHSTPSPVAPSPAPATKPSEAKVIIAKKNTPSPKKPPEITKETRPTPRELPEATKEPVVLKQNRLNEPKVEPLPKREPARENIITADRRLPSLKELLPPRNWSPSTQPLSRSDGPVRLDTRDPQYITYFGSIKRAIEVVWQYPELALRYGLQGKLLMEFTVLGNGELSRARIIRSSGSTLLDEEALRAVNQAAPFSPIPPWIGKSRIDILASFEYHDNRLNYNILP